MPDPGWNIYWPYTPTGDIPNLFATADWRPWRTNTEDVYITPSPVLGEGCVLYLEDPPSGYEIVIAGGYTHGLSVVPSSEFNGDANSRNRWTAVMDLLPTERPSPRTREGDAHAGVFIRVQPDRVWEGHPNQTRFGCFINGLNRIDQGVLQFTGDRIDDPSNMERKLFPFNLSENPFDNPTGQYRIQIIEEERLVSGTWKLQWGAEVWNRSTNPNTKIGELKWITEDDLTAANVAIPALAGYRFAMGLGPGKDGTIVARFVGTAYWYFV